MASTLARRQKYAHAHVERKRLAVSNAANAILDKFNISPNATEFNILKKSSRVNRSQKITHARQKVMYAQMRASITALLKVCIDFIQIETKDDYAVKSIKANKLSNKFNPNVTPREAYNNGRIHIQNNLEFLYNDNLLLLCKRYYADMTINQLKSAIQQLKLLGFIKRHRRYKTDIKNGEKIWREEAKTLYVTKWFFNFFGLSEKLENMIKVIKRGLGNKQALRIECDQQDYQNNAESQGISLGQYARNKARALRDALAQEFKPKHYTGAR